MVDPKEFDFRPHRAGFQATAHFENGFGVSIIPEADLIHYEVAILRHENGNRSHVCYDSGLTDDVCRMLTVDDVHDLIMRVRNLQPGTRILPPEPCVLEY